MCVGVSVRVCVCVHVYISTLQLLKALCFMYKGVPLSEREGSQRKPTQFLDYWTYEQVISKIKSLFPNLQADFDLCRRDTASLKLVSLGTCKNAATIKSSLASSLLYVVPIKVKMQ